MAVRRGWIIGGFAAGVALIACCGIGAGALWSDIEALPDKTSSPVAPAATSAAPAPAPAQTSTPARAAVTAQTVMDAIAAKWPAPNVTDNTAQSCGCVRRLTSDSVTVTEYADAKAAATALAKLKVAGDYRQAGKFLLSWTARDQDLTSEDARRDMQKIATAAD